MFHLNGCIGASERQISSIMPQEEIQLNSLDRLFQEAVSLYGGDSIKVVRYVKARMEALDRADRAAIDEAFERLLAFRAPDCRRRSYN
jgi:hypothetical protein